MATDANRLGALQSPCIDNCCLDENDICLGCGRSMQEIINWSKLTDSERNTVLALCQARQEQRAQKLLVLQQKQP
jgi:predicted Fe-S protein YdhL (DUF1289 family)